MIGHYLDSVADLSQLAGNSYSTYIDRQKRNRRPGGAAQISEFGAAVFILMFCMILPGIFLLRLSFALEVGQIASERAAYLAATACAYDVALQKSQKALRAITSSGIGSLAGLTPCDGQYNQGVDLYVVVKDSKKGKFEIGPNQPLKQAIDTQNQKYYCRLVTHLRMATMPGVSSETKGSGLIAGLDFLPSTITLNFTSSRICENPDSLTVLANVTKPATSDEGDKGAKNAIQSWNQKTIQSPTQTDPGQLAH